jgi:hypothetical protein
MISPLFDFTFACCKEMYGFASDKPKNKFKEIP